MSVTCSNIRSTPALLPPLGKPAQANEEKGSIASHQYIPKELESVLVCITAQFNVSIMYRLSWLLQFENQQRRLALPCSLHQQITTVTTAQ